MLYECAKTREISSTRVSAPSGYDERPLLSLNGHHCCIITCSKLYPAAGGHPAHRRAACRFITMMALLGNKHDTAPARYPRGMGSSISFHCTQPYLTTTRPTTTSRASAFRHLKRKEIRQSRAHVHMYTVNIASLLNQVKVWASSANARTRSEAYPWRDSGHTARKVKDGMRIACR